MLLKRGLVILFGIFLFSMGFTLNASAQQAIIPDWIKNNAGWWSSGLIDDDSFVSGIQWLISNCLLYTSDAADE